MSLALRLTTVVALSSGLYVAAVCLGPLATILVLLVPLPALVLATRRPLAECALWLGLTSAAIIAALGTPGAIGFLLPLGLPTMILAFAIGRFWSFESTALAGIVAWSLGVTCVTLLAFGDVAGMIASAREQLTRSFELALATSGSIGAPDSTVAALAAERDVLVSGLLELLPALVVLAGALIVITNLVLLRSWTGIARNVNLRLWRTPDALIWALIASGFGMFVSTEGVALVARNVFVIVLGCYFCQGLAIVSYYLDRFRLPRGIQVAGYVLIAVQHLVAAMVLALGVFDLWGNFRRLGSADLPLDSDGGE